MGRCTAQWKMLLFCAKTTVRESRKFDCLATFWFGTFAMLLVPLAVFVFHHENTYKDEHYAVITVYKLAVFF